MKMNWKIVGSLIMGITLCSILTFGCSKGDDNNNQGNNSTGYFEYDGHSYLIVKEKKTWMEAVSDAVAQGGYLAEIGSKTEQDAIYQAIQQSGISPTYTQVNDGGGVAYIWIGATDRSTEGGWMWNGAWKSGQIPLFWIGGNDGSPVAGSYANWGGTAAGRLNEPDNFTDPNLSPKGQNAAAIGLAKWPAGGNVELGRAGEWNDIAESNKIYYVVEFDTVK